MCYAVNALDLQRHMIMRIVLQSCTMQACVAEATLVTSKGGSATAREMENFSQGKAGQRHLVPLSVWLPLCTPDKQLRCICVSDDHRWVLWTFSDLVNLDMKQSCCQIEGHSHIDIVCTGFKQPLILMLCKIGKVMSV